MKVRQVREVSIAVRNLQEALGHYKQIFGLEPKEIIRDPRPPVQANWASLRIGDCSLGLMEPTAEGSPVDRFLKKRGEGIFSVSLRVDDMEAAMADLQQQGIQFVLDKAIELENTWMVDKVYRKVKMNFTRPGPLTHGVVFELQELQD